MGEIADASAKRLIDIVGAAILLLLLGPVALAVALFIRAYSPGPLLYCQEREGLHGRAFRIRKLRTMYSDAAERLRQHLEASPAAAAEFARNRCLRRDPRIVGRPGAFVRKYSIDEIPQFWNVLVGEMSLVGPRPLRPSDAELLFDRDTRRQRLLVRPGLSGLWQVTRSGKSDIMRNLAELDLLYVRTRSIWLDLHILLRTPVAVFSGGGLT
jgi:lipopolysaccharide/colanic/teichoic acid biosynthesis glycosyltransferase